MKFLILFLVLSISAQPVQAVQCDIDMETGSLLTHYLEHSDHNTPDGCDIDRPDLKNGCDNAIQCVFCGATVSLISAHSIDTEWGSRYSPDLSTGVILPSHSLPPFRPPIS